MDAGVVLPPDPTSARRARQHVAAALDRAGLDELVETASLLVSELVTNALLHARGEVRVGVAADGGRVRVEVVDSSGRQVSRRRYSPESSTGRGLLLLEELSARWGVDPRAGGKAVWFELSRRSEQVPGSAARRSA